MTGLIDLPWVRGGWGCILADPAWKFSDKATRGAAERHYPTMTGPEIANMPVGEVAARDAVLALWAPDTHLELALAVSKAWGFTYRHLVVWGKFRTQELVVETPEGPVSHRFAGRCQLGLGHYFRKAHEVALLCTRGRPAILDHGVPSIFLAPRTKHSAKPHEMHAALERFCAGPRLELFARAARPGWTSWGNEAPSKTGTEG